MGAFQFELEVGEPQGGRYETVSALVDSAATSTILPESLLRELGVEAMESRTFVVADIGRYNGLGQTCMKKIDGRPTVCPVVFGDDNYMPLHRAVTPKILALGVDTVHSRPVHSRPIDIPSLA